LKKKILVMKFVAKATIMDKIDLDNLFK